jgi:hypothetical protein
MHWEARLRRLAALQLGVIGIHQMPSLGGDHRWWTQARRNGRWEAPSHNVLRGDGTPATAEQRAFAGVLDAGPSAFLFGEPAMAWFGLRNRRLEPVDIGRVRGTSNRPCALARPHRLRDLGPTDVVLVRGLPVLSPIRLLWWEAERLAGLPLEWGVPRLERVADELHRAKLVRWDQLHASIRALGKRGRAGTVLMRESAWSGNRGAASPRAGTRTGSSRSWRTQALRRSWRSRSSVTGRRRSVGRTSEIPTCRWWGGEQPHVPLHAVRPGRRPTALHAPRRRRLRRRRGVGGRPVVEHGRRPPRRHRSQGQRPARSPWRPPHPVVPLAVRLPQTTVVTCWAGVP